MTPGVAFVDLEELPDGVEFFYSVRAVFAEGHSPYSDEASKFAVNKPPVAVDDTYESTDAPLTIPAPGVLANDTDVDSGPASRRLAQITVGPSNGSLTANTDGSFTYTPNAGFAGVDTFKYEADNGLWSDTNIALSGRSNAATVTITVVAAQLLFRNVQNLPPPPGRKFNTGSTVPVLWQWLNSAGVAVNTGSDPVVVQAFACSTSGTLPGGFPTGVFMPAQPGSGNSFAYNSASNTWQFNWKLVYTVNGVVFNLPAGDYVLLVKRNAAGPSYPGTTHSCANNTQVTGALLTVR
jgi:hypothetical protein